MKGIWKAPLALYIYSFLGPLVSATLEHYTRFPFNLKFSHVQHKCPPITEEQDDLPGFDLISKFQIDRAASVGAIKTVVGTSPFQVAYQLGTNVDFRIQTRYIYASGLPEVYSFMFTFRMRDGTQNKYWSIWQIVDSSGKQQAAINFNGPKKALEFVYKATDGKIHTVTFPNLPFLFNNKFHKVMFSVEKTKLTLFIDCIKVDTFTLVPRGKITVDGYTILGKLKNNHEIAVPVSVHPF
ncbi:hypothetical protein XELAEV_18027389mg [Xenopus laevis]|uniref:Collagen alpha-1(IX) chain n=1 Tax=Xenopus laevis TaxID=8355 RepID=A0A974CXH8_XENLA|nr:hypothetical protein XELAEV_18027389mg [Xenopus laevis]